MGDPNRLGVDFRTTNPDSDVEHDDDEIHLGEDDDEEDDFDATIKGGSTARSVVSESALEEIRSRVVDLFRTFDEGGDGEWLEIKEVGNVLRCLGFSPSIDEVDQLTDHLMKTGDKVHFDHFLPRIVAALEGREWPRQSREELFAAFETLTDGRFINKDKLIAMLTTLGEPLNAQEAQQMLNHLAINRDGDVDWAAYVDDVLEHITQ